MVPDEDPAIGVSDPAAVGPVRGEWRATYWSPRERTNLNAVACRGSEKAESMF